MAQSRKGQLKLRGLSKQQNKNIVSASVSVALTVFLNCGQTANSAPDSSSETLPSDRRRPANPFGSANCESFPALTKKLRGNEGFIGGDAAYSIKLSPEKSLWLFGDSLIGKIVHGNRQNFQLVRNTIAIDDPNKPGGSPVFYNRFPAFFKTTTGNFYWPGDGVMLGDKLYLFLHETENKRDKRPPYQFNPFTDHLIVVQNPLSDPTRWQFKDTPLANRSTQILVGTACLLDGDYLYVYCANRAIGFGIHKNPTALARIKKEDLIAGKTDKMQWLAAGWQSSARLLDTLWEDGDAGMTVTKVPGFPGYFAFYLPFGNKALAMRHADHPEGPWSKPIAVCNLPASPHDISFYSAKAHLQYARAKGEVALTYCTNSSLSSRVVSDATLDFPEAVRIKIVPAK